MKRYVHLGFNSGVTWTISYRPIVEKFLTENADDWFRISGENYVLWTDQDLAVLAQGIRALPGLNHFTVFASVFSCDTQEMNGVMPQAFWDWLHLWRSQF